VMCDAYDDRDVRCDDSDVRCDGCGVRCDVTVM
jgi:hypothetical protein